MKTATLADVDPRGRDPHRIDPERLQRVWEDNERMLGHFARSTAASGVSLTGEAVKDCQVQHPWNPRLRFDITMFFKGLAAARCGTFVVGRRGRESRFRWMYTPDSLLELVRNNANNWPPSVAPPPESESGENSTTPSVLDHVFLLRLDSPVTVQLPSSLTAGEAGRLATFISALPFADDPGASPPAVLDHVFLLRSDLPVTVQLPSSLTAMEASRLARFITALPFGEA